VAHRRSLGFPGFPVESCGFGQLRVVLLEENHIRVADESSAAGNPGTLGMTEKEGVVVGEGRLLEERAVSQRRGLASKGAGGLFHQQLPSTSRADRLTGTINA
jgi:hypothetical protein